VTGEKKPPMRPEESWMFELWPRRLLILEDRVEVRGTEVLPKTGKSLGYD
jgi:hypothetical protein